MQPANRLGSLRFATLCVAVIAASAAPGPIAAQDANILLPIDTVEQRLIYGDFEIIDARPSRGLPNERTLRAALSFGDGSMMVVKWAPAPSGGEEFNNNPRYELAAYEIQKLFLEPNEYVVPPTVVRAFTKDWHTEHIREEPATFWETQSVIVVLQYWLFNVTDEDFWNRDRLAKDTAYARNFGNFNILTYLVRHRDENAGNFLISAAPGSRVFSVDNGLAFASEASDQGDRWRRLQVDRLPAATMDRLRALTEEEMTEHLQTLVQFRIQSDGTLAREAPGPATNPDRGVRRDGDLIQFGLTRREIRDVWRRVEDLVEDVDNGKIEVF